MRVWHATHRTTSLGCWDPNQRSRIPVEVSSAGFQWRFIGDLFSSTDRSGQGRRCTEDLQAGGSSQGLDGSGGKVPRPTGARWDPRDPVPALSRVLWGALWKSGNRRRTIKPRAADPTPCSSLASPDLPRTWEKKGRAVPTPGCAGEHCRPHQMCENAPKGAEPRLGAPSADGRSHAGAPSRTPAVGRNPRLRAVSRSGRKTRWSGRTLRRSVESGAW